MINSFINYNIFHHTQLNIHIKCKEKTYIRFILILFQSTLKETKLGNKILLYLNDTPPPRLPPSSPDINWLLPL